MPLVVLRTSVGSYKGLEKNQQWCGIKPLTMFTESRIRLKSITFMLIIVPEAIKKFNNNFHVILKIFRVAILFFTEGNHANIFVNSNFHFDCNQFETSAWIKRPRKKNSGWFAVPRCQWQMQRRWRIGRNTEQCEALQASNATIFLTVYPKKQNEITKI